MSVSSLPPGMPPLPPAGRESHGDGDEQYYGFDLSEQVLKAIGVTPRIKSDLEYLLGLGKKLTSSEMSDYYIDFMSCGHEAFMHKPPRPILPLINVLPKWLLEKRLTDNLKYQFLKILARPSGNAYSFFCDDLRDYDSQYGIYHYAVMILALLEAKSKTQDRGDKDFLNDCIKFCCYQCTELKETDLIYRPFLQSFLIDTARNLGNECGYKKEISWMINQVTNPDNFNLLIEDGQQALKRFSSQADPNSRSLTSKFHGDAEAEEWERIHGWAMGTTPALLWKLVPDDKRERLQERTRELQNLLNPDSNTSATKAWDQPLGYTIAMIRKKKPTKIYIDAKIEAIRKSYGQMFRLIRACCTQFDPARLDMKRWWSRIDGHMKMFQSFNLKDELSEQQVKGLIKEFLAKDQTLHSTFQNFIRDEAPDTFKQLERHSPPIVRALNKIKQLQLTYELEIQDLFEPNSDSKKQEVIVYDSGMPIDPPPIVSPQTFIVKNISIHSDSDDYHPDCFEYMFRNVLRGIGQERHYGSNAEHTIVAIPISKGLKTFASSLDQEKLVKNMGAKEFCDKSDVILVHFYNFGDGGGGDEVTVNPVLDPVLTPA